MSVPVVEVELDCLGARAQQHLFRLDVAVRADHIDREEPLDHDILRAASRSAVDP